MVTDINQLDVNKKYTYADYLQWAFKERVELIKGMLFKMSPAPNLFHQKVSMILANKLYNFLQGKKCQVFTAPFDVRLTQKNNDKEEHIENVVQPDICVVCDPAKLDVRGCQGAPDLIVEILSPSSSKRDLKDKYALYQENAVQAYWVVHPMEQTILVYTLDDNGQYQAGPLMTRGDQIDVGVLPGLIIALDDIFEETHVDF